MDDTSKLLLPAEIVEQAQRALRQFEAQHQHDLSPDEITRLAYDQMQSVLAQARVDLDTYYDHRSADHLPTRRECDPHRAERAINRALAGISSAVMIRWTVFEALDFATTHSRAEQETAFEANLATRSNNTLMQPGGGEDLYLSALVRRMDHALLTFYRYPQALGYIEAYKTPYLLAYHDGREDTHDDFDPWNICPIHVLDRDRPHTRDVNRIALRHFAETLMNLLQLLPMSIVDAFEESDLPLPRVSLLELQKLFLSSVPVLAQLSSLHVKGEIDTRTDARQRRDPRAFGELVCILDAAGAIAGFEWRDRVLTRSGRAGRCPARFRLPGLHGRQQQTIQRLQELDFGFTTHQTPGHMSTVEALLLLAIFDAPLLWSEQLEAHLICPELDQFRNWNVTTLYDDLQLQRAETSRSVVQLALPGMPGCRC